MSRQDSTTDAGNVQLGRTLQPYLSGATKCDIIAFDDDAKKVAEARNIVLTGRDMGTGQRVPLAGVPYHAVETYLARLINAGHKVAIVEQTSDEPIQGLMTREVVRVVSHRIV